MQVISRASLRKPTGSNSPESATKWQISYGNIAIQNHRLNLAQLYFVSAAPKDPMMEIKEDTEYIGAVPPNRRIGRQRAAQ